jgi:broad specificity phosphatase PhoE
MIRWLLVRHAETSWNLEGRVQGHVATPLSDRGREQAEALRAHLAEDEIEVAYASDLPRAVETAEVILRGRDVPLFLAPEMRELSYGQWEGLTYTEVQEQDPEGFARLLQAGIDFAPPAGETIEELMLRVTNFVSRVKAAHPRAALVVVGHGGPLRGLILHLLGLPVSAFWRIRLDPASLSILETSDQGGVLHLLNDTSHYWRLL